MTAWKVVMWVAIAGVLIWAYWYFFVNTPNASLSTEATNLGNTIVSCTGLRKSDGAKVAYQSFAKDSCTKPLSVYMGQKGTAVFNTDGSCTFQIASTGDLMSSTVPSDGLVCGNIVNPLM